MRRYERGYVSVPTAQQYCSASIIALRQTKPAVFLPNFDSKRAELRESLEIFRRNFAGAIDLVWIDMFAQIIFQLANKIFASDAILCTLRGIRINPIEIVTSDEQIAGETAAVLERIARRFRQLKRLALAFGHLRCIDDSRRRLLQLSAGFLNDLFFRRFERRFHIISSTDILSVGTLGILPGV